MRRIMKVLAGTALLLVFGTLTAQAATVIATSSWHRFADWTTSAGNRHCAGQNAEIRVSTDGLQSFGGARARKGSDCSTAASQDPGYLGANVTTVATVGGVNIACGVSGWKYNTSSTTEFYAVAYKTRASCGHGTVRAWAFGEIWRESTNKYVSDGVTTISPNLSF